MPICLPPINALRHIFPRIQAFIAGRFTPWVKGSAMGDLRIDEFGFSRLLNASTMAGKTGKSKEGGDDTFP